MRVSLAQVASLRSDTQGFYQQPAVRHCLDTYATSSDWVRRTIARVLIASAHPHARRDGARAHSLYSDIDEFFVVAGSLHPMSERHGPQKRPPLDALLSLPLYAAVDALAVSRHAFVNDGLLELAPGDLVLDRQRLRDLRVASAVENQQYSKVSVSLCRVS